MSILSEVSRKRLVLRAGLIDGKGDKGTFGKRPWLLRPKVKADEEGGDGTNCLSVLLEEWLGLSVEVPDGVELRGVFSARDSSLVVVVLEPPKSEALGIALRRCGPRRRVNGFQAEGGLACGDDVLRPENAAKRRPMLFVLKIELVEGEEFDACVASLWWDSREDVEEGRLGNRESGALAVAWFVLNGSGDSGAVSSGISGGVGLEFARARFGFQGFNAICSGDGLLGDGDLSVKGGNWAAKAFRSG
ncbi:hypothetical protein PM082_012859 [Marasmius tenuissimus]|nr:hypothetical protein PM082_012859 [Marasmius tenuissimus]